jgi:hypothetical protein
MAISTSKKLVLGTSEYCIYNVFRSNILDPVYIQ